MNRSPFLVSSLAIALIVGCGAQPKATGTEAAAAPTGEAAPAPAPVYSIDSKIGDILDDPKAKEVLVSYWPAANSSQMSMARGMSLRGIAPFAQGLLSDEKLAEIDQGLRTMTVNPNPPPPRRPKEESSGSK